MREMYFNIIYNYGVLITSGLSLVIYSLLLLNLNQKFYEKLSFLLLLLVSLVSLEFYPYQLFSFPLNIIIPIGIILLFTLKKQLKTKSKTITIMSLFFSLYLILGLVFYSASANTWGEGPAPYGAFIIPNSLVILLVLFTRFKQQNLKYYIAFQLLIAVIGFLLIYISTSGFYYGEYDGNEVKLRRISSVLVCFMCLLNSCIIYRYLKLNKNEKN